MADIIEQMNFVDSTPQEAAQHIDNAKVFNIGADVFKDYKEDLQPEINKLDRPKEATTSVAQYVTKSKEHAALAAPDIANLSKAEIQIQSAGNRMAGKDLDKDIADLQMRKEFRPDSFSQEDDYKLFVLQEDLKERNKYKSSEPNKHEDLIRKTTESAKQTSTFDEFSFALAKGTADLYSSIGKAPSLLYDAYFYPANLIRQSRGEELITSPEGLIDNPIVQRYDEASQFFAQQTPDLNKSISESVSKRNFIEAGKVAALQLTANAPTQMSLLLAGVTGFGTAGLISAGVTTAAQSNYESQKAGITPLVSVPNALGKGSIEAAFESIGTFGMLKSWESALSNSFGKETASKVFQQTMKAVLASSAAEANEEALTSAAQDLTDYFSGVNPNALKGIGWRALDAGVVGGLSGGTMTAPTAAISGIAKARANRSDIVTSSTELPKTPTAKAIDALNFDSELSSVVKTLNETEMSQTAPGEVAEITKGMLKEKGIDNLYFDKETLTKWANTKEKAEAVRNIIDPSGETAAQYNAPIRVEPHKFMELAIVYPDITEQVKMSPEAANAIQAKEWLARQQAADVKRQDLLASLGLPETSEADRIKIEEQLSTIQEVNDVLGESDYLNDQSLSDAAKLFVPEVQLDNFLQAHFNAKMQVVDNINENAQYEMDRVRDVLVEAATEAQVQQETLNVQNDPNLAIVDRFTKGTELFPTQRYRTLDETTAAHQKPGFSPFAIDPRTLNEKQKAKYLKDKQLRKHKVFVKGGINAEESARLIGVNGADNLLKLLSRTPSRQDIIDQQVAMRQKEIQDRVNASVDLNDTAIAKAYAADLANAMTTLKFMKDKEWPALRGVIKRIALEPPPIEQIVNQAKTYVDQTPIGELNVNQFKVGRRKSHRLAMQEVLRGNFEEAFKHQIAVATNIALANETQIKIAKVNRVTKFIRKMNSPEVRQILKDAGPLYQNAVNEILSAYNFSPNKDLAEQGSFAKWAKEMMETGEGNFEIPERFQSTKTSAKELTVEQVLLLGDRLNSILHKAKFKNRLFLKHETLKAIQTVKGFATLLHNQAISVFDYDPNRNQTKSESAVTPWEKFHRTVLAEANIYLERAQYTIAKLDGGKATGVFNDLLYRPFVDADKAKKELTGLTQKHLQAIIEKFGKKEFDNLKSEFVNVPEFEKIKVFKNGRISKAELLVMELNFGNEGNIKVLERFGVTRDVVRQVLDRELSNRHTELAQDIWNIFETFKPKIAELQKRTDGTDVEWVKAVPFTARGKQYPGGYYPIHLSVDEKNIKRKNLQGTAETNRIANFKQKYYAQTMTDQGHLESRTEGADPLDTNLNRLSQSLERVIHDLTAREAIRDTIKLLADEQIAFDIVAVVGNQGFRNIADMVIDTAEGLERKNFAEDNFAAGILRQLGGGLQTVAIAGKITSFAIQPVSILFAINRMGNVSGSKYFSKAVRHLLTNPKAIGEFMNFAEEIHPPLRASREDLEGKATAAFDKLLPSRKYPVVSVLQSTRDLITEQAFGALGKMDQANKTIVAMAAYMQAMEGEAPGVEKGNYEAARIYASNIVELTQTSNEVRNLSPIQKNKWLKWATYFYSDLNNVYNNTIHVARETKRQFQESGTAAKERDWKRARNAAAEGVGNISGLMLIFSLAKLWESVIRGKPTPFGGEEDKDPEEFLEEVAKWFLTSPMEILDTIPLARDVKFATGKYWEKKKTVDMPIDSALGSFATAWSGLGALLDSDKDMTAREKRELLISIGIITKLPTGAVYNYFVKPDFDTIPIIGGVIGELKDSIESYKSRHEEMPEELRKQLDDIEADLEPRSQISIPEEALPVIRQIVSQGNPFAYNAETQSVGLYQFTQKVWDNIREQAPELGLTENGLESDSSEQQEKAMEWVTERNMEALQKAELPVTTENLYASHLLGFSKAIQVLRSTSDTKLKTLVDEGFMKTNEFQNSAKVKDFKDWLDLKVKSAKDQLETKD